jgi:hypothetical protein
VPYTKAYAGGWQNGSAGSTPISAASLNTMEAGIETAFNNFQIAATAPTSPSTGYIWFDTVAGTHKYWNGTDWVGVYSESAINAQVGSYTLVITDQRKMVEMSGGGTLTVPTNTSVPFPVTTQITILQTGSSQVTVAGAGGVTVNARIGLKLAGQWSAASLIKRATNTWVLLGDTTA